MLIVSVPSWTERWHDDEWDQIGCHRVFESFRREERDAMRAGWG